MLRKFLLRFAKRQIDEGERLLDLLQFSQIRENEILADPEALQKNKKKRDEKILI